jgi:hypothetical protein
VRKCRKMRRSLVAIPLLLSITNALADEASVCQRISSVLSDCKNNKNDPVCLKLIAVCKSSAKGVEKKNTRTARAETPPAQPNFDTESSPTEPQQQTYNRLLVRQDREDTFYDGGVGGATDGKLGQSKGASISYGGNLHLPPTTAKGSISHPLTSTIQAFISYNLFDSPLFVDTPTPFTPKSQTLVMPSVFIETNGTWDEPSKATDYSYLRVGPNINFGSYLNNNSLLEAILWNANAYYQTDYFGVASIHGIDATISPYIPDLLLGSDGQHFLGDLATTFFYVRPEIDYSAVDNPGHTLLRAHNYVWLGGTVRGYFFPFQSPVDPLQPSNWPSFISDRLAITGGYDIFKDARSNALAKSYSLGLAYTLSGCKTNETTTDTPAKANQKNGYYCSRDGASSIAFDYSGGKDRYMYVYQHKYTVNLTYKY